MKEISVQKLVVSNTTAGILTLMFKSDRQQNWRQICVKTKILTVNPEAINESNESPSQLSNNL